MIGPVPALVTTPGPVAGSALPNCAANGARVNVPASITVAAKMRVRRDEFHRRVRLICGVTRGTSLLIVMLSFLSQRPPSANRWAAVALTDLRCARFLDAVRHRH